MNGSISGSQQWGVSDIGMEALKNPRLIQAARTEAHVLVQKDPQLSAHRALRDHIETVAAELHST